MANIVPSDKLSKKDLAESRIYPAINTPAKAGVVMMKAKALDLDPTFIAENLIFIGGKAAGTGLLLAVLCKRSKKYRYIVKQKTAKLCTVEFKEKVDSRWESIGTETFTMEMAVRAGLTSNPSWKKFPEAMLFWRCLSSGVRTHCPDVIAGVFSHLVEELQPQGEYDEEGIPVLKAEMVEVELVSDTTTLQGLINQTNTDINKVLKFYEVDSVEQMTASQVAECISNLKTKLESM